MQRNCRGTSKCLQSCWGLEKLVFGVLKVSCCGVASWALTKFGDKRVNDLDLLSGYVVGVACLHRENPCRLHAARSPYVLIICSLPVVFVCNALFLFLLLYFHMYKPETNLVNVCAQLISLRNEHFFGDTFGVLCFHMYKLQAYFENISVLRILLEKAMP